MEDQQQQDQQGDGCGPPSPVLGGGDAYAASYEAISASMASWTEGGTGASAPRASFGGGGGGGRHSVGTVGTAGRPSFATAHTSQTDDDDDMDFNVFDEEEDGDDDDEDYEEGGMDADVDDEDMLDEDNNEDEPEDVDLTGEQEEQDRQADGSFRSPLGVPFRTPLSARGSAAGAGSRQRGPVRTPGTAFRSGAGAPVDTPAAAGTGGLAAADAEAEAGAEAEQDEAGDLNDDDADEGSNSVRAADYYGYGADGPYRPYHDALLRYLKARTTQNARSDLLDREAELDREEAGGGGGGGAIATMEEGEAIAQQREQLSEDVLKTELDLLLALSGAASSRRSLPPSSFDDGAASASASGSSVATGSTDVAGNNNSARDKNTTKNVQEEARNESNVWLLLQSLRTLGLEGVLYDSSPGATADQRAAASQRIYDVARGGVDATPAEVLDKYLTGTTSSTDKEGEDEDAVPMIVARRAELLRWAEKCQSQRIGSVPTARIGGSGAQAAVGYLAKPLGGPASASASAATFGAPMAFGTSPTSVMTDDPADLALLQACLVRLKSGPIQWATALDLCRSSGQPWRAASMSGGNPYGRESFEEEDAMMSEDAGEEKKEDGSNTREFGNPDRALWKRMVWKMSRALASSSSASTSKCTELEGAIYALLADDAETALASPSLRSWEDGLLIYLRSKVSRYAEEVLAAHNDARRVVGIRYPYRGTDHGPSEREQLTATAAASNLSESDIFRALASSPYANIREEAADPLRAAIAAIVTGSDETASFITSAADNASASDHSMLRFIAHLALYLDFAAPEFLQSLGDMVVDGETALPVREYYLLRYVDRLTSEKGLWHLAALYASLLPEPMLIEVFSDFLTNVHEDGFRRKVLRQMREYFTDGLDLVVLRRTVRMIIFDQAGEDRFGYAFLRLLGGGGRQKRSGSRAAKLDEMLTSADVCKMHSVRWLCYVPEHAPDALICANSLLRQLFLNITVENVTDGEEDDPALHCARVFLTRFLPKDTAKNALRHALEAGESGEESASTLSPEEVEDASAEFGALEAYVDARIAVDRWQSEITSTSAEYFIRGITSSGGDSVEGTVANKMERRNFLHKKRNAGLQVINAANDAKEKLMAVLTYEGGWLATSNTTSSDSVIDENEHVNRINEMSSLRTSCLPHAVFLLHAVLDGTAEWMEVFLADAERAYGEEGETMLIDLIRNNNGPFLPGYWYRSCLDIAVTVARDEYNLRDAFQKEGMEEFVGLMAECNVNWLRTTQKAST